MIAIEATKSTPKILYRPELGVLELSGESYPENSFTFFEPVFLWFNTVLPTLRTLRLEISIRYMNSSSTKCLLDLLDQLTEASDRGCQVAVIWYYDEGNHRALDLAEEFKEDFTFPFEILPLALGGLGL